MDKCSGKWKFESGEGFDDFLKDRGIGKVYQYFSFYSGIAVRTVIKTTTPTLTFTKKVYDSCSMNGYYLLSIYVISARADGGPRSPSAHA
jgi:hypothetical protein